MSFGRMPVGPFAGRCICDVPTEELAYAIGDVGEPHFTQIEAELESRGLIAESMAYGNPCWGDGDAFGGSCGRPGWDGNASFEPPPGPTMFGYVNVGPPPGTEWSPPPPPEPPPADVPAESAIARVRREMARQFHPDTRGGSHREMSAVNSVLDRLEELAREE